MSRASTWTVADEVEVSVNGQALGFLAVSENDQLEISSFDIDASLLADGVNTLSFTQTRSAEWTWGVTEIVLYGPGPHELDVDIDPEFLDDYVVWQTGRGFHMGRIDLTTGLLVETLNTAEYRPIPLSETLQGPEVMRTTQGVVGIGMTDAGLVWFSETESGLLAGTEGMILGFLPKGVTPGLRFAMSDADGNQYLYDNGDISLLELHGGTASSWLNAHEVVVSFFNTSKDVLTIYDVETDKMSLVTDSAYFAVGQQAAITTEQGERYITISAGLSYDIWRDGPAGWTLVQTITSPVRGWYNIDSVEFFEWNGGLFISGIVVNQPGLGTYVDTIPVLYDVSGEAWTVLAGVGDYMDPEVVVLNNGSVAFNYYDINRMVSEFIVVSPDEVNALPKTGAQVSVRFGVPVLASLPCLADTPMFGGPAPSVLLAEARPATDRPQLQSSAGLEGADTFVFRPGRTVLRSLPDMTAPAKGPGAAQFGALAGSLLPALVQF